MASREGSGGGGGVGLDHLIALNDEIAALSRAGVPLERGLLGVGGDLGGRLGAITRALGERMSRGEGLAQALAAEGEAIPPVYRAVVEAGLRAGRLPAALEGLSAYARGYAEMRRSIGLALLYPLMVLALAYGLFLAFVLLVLPRFLAAFASLRLPVARPLVVLEAARRWVPVWGPVVPVVLVLVAAAWFASGRAKALGTGGIVGWVPWMRGMLASMRAANFAELLALLLEHRVPLPEAVELAAAAEGDRATVRAGRAVAEAARRGEAPRAMLAEAGGLPPLLGWLLADGLGRGDPAPALRHAAETYRRRALRQADLARVLVPTVLMLGLGASAVLAYALTLFLPLAALWRSLALES